MTATSRRKFLRNAGLGFTGFTIPPMISGAKVAENLSSENGIETIEDKIDLCDFNKGKSSKPYFRNQVEDLSLKQMLKSLKKETTCCRTKIFTRLWVGRMDL